MSTSATFAAISASNAAVSAQYAHEAEVSRCKMVLPNFNNSTATVEQMKDYSGCVKTLYPSPMSGGEIVVAKAFFVIALLGGAIGLWYANQDAWDRTIVGYTLFFFLGFMTLPFLIACVCGILAGIVWLFQ